MFHCHNLSKKFGSKNILNKVSLSINKGEIAVLLGPSGVGKSTLLRVLNNLETVDEGKISADFSDIGLVFQGYHLFDHLNALDNIALPLKVSQKKQPQEAKKLAEQLLEQFHIKELKASFPSQMSGGQKQRLAIARAMAMKPSVLCLDEPTSALDPKSRENAIREIKQLAKQGMMILITTHDTSLIHTLECTVHLMEGGKIIESGQSNALHECPKILSYLQ